MGSSLVFLALFAAGAGTPLTEEDVATQESTFGQMWNEDFDWKFATLPTEGSVPDERIPYSGYIYLDTKGGTANTLRKYDLAVNQDSSLPATSWENQDTSAAWSGNRSVTVGFGRFRRTRVVGGGVNAWYGHCNGWSSAAIRHAEPQFSVKSNGQIFTPADIKGLLAEIYMYNDHRLLAGYESDLNPGALHAILANWIGRGLHPIVMDADPSKEKWNYPIYAFASNYKQHSDREVEVRTTIVYAKDTDDREHDKSPRLHQEKSFHYSLDLNESGEITGGTYYWDSDRIDFLWLPLAPKASGSEGNERGNPNIDVARVLEIWRQSVPREVRRKWMIVDPHERDRAMEVADPTRMLPRRIRIVPPSVAVTEVATGG